jgi:rod shape-determining protein MreC
MIGFLTRHRTGFTFVAIVIILLSIIAGQVPAPEHPSLLAWGLYAIVSPVQQTAAYAVYGAVDIWENYIDLRSVSEENEALKKELSELHRDNQKLRETLAMVGGEQELKAFQELFNETYNYQPLVAMVIGAGSDGSEHTIILNRGSLHGVEIDQGVICPTGVVGKVIRVGPGSCLVQLITDSYFAMAARLQNSRVQGIVQGTGGEICQLKYVRDTDALAVNNRVVSSGLEQIFPRGILIGRVSKVSPGVPPLRDVQLKPAAELRSLEWVLVIQWRQNRGE